MKAVRGNAVELQVQLRLLALRKSYDDLAEEIIISNHSHISTHSVMVYMFKLNYDYGVTSHEGIPLLFGRSFVFFFFFF